jgi:cytochrome c oxidase subunit 2
MEDNNNGKSNNIIIAIIIIAIVIFGGWYIISKNKSGDDTQNIQEVNELENEIEESTVSEISTVKEFTVDGSNFKFTPSIMEVNKGDTVKITFKNKDGFHDLKIDEFNVATKQIKGGAEETVTFVADKSGSFVYYCSVGAHRANGMWGTLTVK